MANEDIKTLEVNPGKYAITTDNLESPMIEHLEGCVGVALIQKSEGRIKRGLAHVFFGGTLKMFDDQAMAAADRVLNEYLSSFILKEPSVRQDDSKVEPIRAITAYIPCIYNGQSWLNPMATFVMDWLPRRGINLLKEDVDSTQTYPAERGQQISHKTFVLHANEALVIYRDRLDHMINHPDLKKFRL